jgi:hypothetical protein
MMSKGNIRTLVLLDGGFFIYPETVLFERIFPLLPNLQNLTISGDENCSNYCNKSNMTRLVRSCPNMETFCDLQCFGMPFRGLKYAIKNWINLRSLTLNLECKNVYELRSTLKYVPQLTELKISHLSEPIKTSRCLNILNHLLRDLKKLSHFKLDLETSPHMDGLNAQEMSKILKSTAVTQIDYKCSIESYQDTELSLFPAGAIIWTDLGQCKVDDRIPQLQNILIEIKDFFSFNFIKWTIVCSI